MGLHRNLSTIVFALPLLFAACSTPVKTSESGGATAGPDSIVNTYWKLVELNGRPVSMGATASREPHLILHTNDGRVSGSGGCNNFSGTYELRAGSRIRFTPLAATKMACTDMDTEGLFFRALEQADSYYLRGDSLQLNRARMAPLARFVAVYLR